MIIYVRTTNTCNNKGCGQLYELGTYETLKINLIPSISQGWIKKLGWEKDNIIWHWCRINLSFKGDKSCQLYHKYYNALAVGGETRFYIQKTYICIMSSY